jgi:two-component system response regulator RegA
MGVGQAVRTILAVDDDTTLLAGYQRAFGRESKRVLVATSIAAARRLADAERPELAVVDLRIGNEWGVDLIEALKRDLPTVTIVLVSAFLSVSAAVAAVKAGATHVMFKPATCKEILRHVEDLPPDIDPRDEPMPSLARQEWELVMRALADCRGNVSETARRLGIHRQSLQQRLKKPIPPS